MKRFIQEAAAIVLAAIVCAAVANGLAARERQLKWKKDALPGRPQLSTSTVAPVESTETTVDATTVSTTIVPATTTSATTTSAVRTTASTPSTALTSTSAVVKPTTPVAPPTTTTVATAPPKPATDLVKQYPAHPDKPWVEISGDDVVKLYAAKAPVFDARRSDAYREGHVAGAESMPVWEADIDDRVKNVYERNLNSERPIVVYCTGGDCEDSHMLAQKLWGIGLNNVLVYHDGFPDWQKRGGAITKGEKP